MTATTNADLAKQVGDVRQTLGTLIEGQRSAEKGRGVLHDKLDRLLDAVQLQAIATASATKDAALAVTTAAQTRDRVDALDREIKPSIIELKQQGKDLFEQITTLHKADSEAAPLLDTMKQARNLLSVLIGIAGVSTVGIGTLFAFFNDAAKHAVLSWLGLA